MKKRDETPGGTEFDPPICMTDEGRQIRIIISLPGIAEEKIRIDLEKTIFTLSVSQDAKILKKSIRVPADVRFFKKKFSGGVLEIFLEKQVP
ncbi:MAG: hypothetical protein LUQ31_10205 [Methanoregula sp.]|nr:hypothetical protein [Methanoregula sp.]